MNDRVSALTVFDDGSGPALYAGRSFTTAGGVSANDVAQWDGTSWSALGTGMNRTVLALTAFDDGGGPALFAGGPFTTAGGFVSVYIAEWSCAPRSPADFNADGGVDLADYAFLQACMKGPAGAPLEEGCETADVSGDGRVDLLDFALFQTPFGNVG
jgi:hypothetical protein